MVIGIILTVVGALLTGWAHNQMDSLDYRISQAFFDGDDNGIINLAYYAGIALLVIGVIVFLISCVRYLSSKNKKEETENASNPKATSIEHYPFSVQNQASLSGVSYQQNSLYCKNCGNAITREDRFCSKCGKALTMEKAHNTFPYQ